MRLRGPLISMSVMSNGAEAEQRNATTSGNNVVFPNATELPKSKAKNLWRANTMNQQGSIQTFQQKYVGSNIHTEYHHWPEQLIVTMSLIKWQPSKSNISQHRTKNVIRLA